MTFLKGGVDGFRYFQLFYFLFSCLGDVFYYNVVVKRVVYFILFLGDVLSEDAILKWYKEGHSTKGKSTFLEQMKKFIEWLENAEEGREKILWGEALTFQINNTFAIGIFCFLLKQSDLWHLCTFFSDPFRPNVENCNFLLRHLSLPVYDFRLQKLLAQKANFKYNCNEEKNQLSLLSLLDI